MYLISNLCVPKLIPLPKPAVCGYGPMHEVLTQGQILGPQADLEL